MSQTPEEGLSALLHETRTFAPPEELAKEADAQPGIYAEAESDPLAFWASQAERLTWDTPWTDILEWNLPFAKWFVGGTLNVAVIPSTVTSPPGSRFPDDLHWEGEPGDTRTITYADLLTMVSQAANGADQARRPRRGQGGHLHADDPRDGGRHAGLGPAGRSPHGGLRTYAAARCGVESWTATPF